MKPEHSEIIEAMADAMFVTVTASMREDVKAALRAAAELGYRLAKLPERKGYCSASAQAAMEGRHWNDCLDAIETIEIDKEQSE